MRRLLALTVLLALAASLPQQAPAQTLQARIDDAAPGDTLYVERGTHAGPLIIGKALVLVGRAGATIDGGGNGHVIAIEAPRVTVAGLTIRGSGARLADDHAGVMVKGGDVVVRDNRLRDVLHGVYVKGAKGAHVAGNDIAGKRALPRPQRGNGIHLWKSTGNVVEGNRVTGTRDGVYFSFTDSTRATGNAIRGVRYGLHYMYSDGNTFVNNDFSESEAGSAIMYSDDLTARGNAFHDNRSHQGYGLLLQSVEDATFTRNRLTRNTTGLYLENSNRNVFRQNRVASNHRGLRLTGSSVGNTFSQNTITGNLQAAALSATRSANEWSAGGAGNYWGRAGGGADFDGDGAGELPRHTADLFAARREAFPYVALLAASPGVELLSRAVERLPPPGLPMITDPHPLGRPPLATDGASGRPRRVAAGGVLALVLLTGVASWTRRVAA